MTLAEFVVFFFSSRRRHTRLQGDWSSDVCSSDLLLERLAALTPRPRINVVLYHGVLAPRAKWRAAAVAYGRADTTATQDDTAPIAGPAEAATSPAAIPGGADRRAAAGPTAVGVPLAAFRPGAVT